MRVELRRDDDLVAAEVVSGRLDREWTLRWNRGPSVTGTGRELELRLP